MSFLNPVSWFAVWNGYRWTGPKRLTHDQADNWFTDTMNELPNQPLTRIQLWNWNGVGWMRKR